MIGGYPSRQLVVACVRHLSGSSLEPPRPPAPGQSRKFPVRGFKLMIDHHPEPPNCEKVRRSAAATSRPRLGIAAVSSAAGWRRSPGSDPWEPARWSPRSPMRTASTTAGSCRHGWDWCPGRNSSEGKPKLLDISARPRPPGPRAGTGSASLWAAPAHARPPAASTAGAGSRARRAPHPPGRFAAHGRPARGR